MKRVLAASAALMASTSLVAAGGIDRGTPSTAILFEEGTYVELGFSAADPDVTGALEAAPTVESGDVLAGFIFGALRAHYDVNDRLSISVIADQPYGASTDYPEGTGYPFAGSVATITTQQLTAAARYEVIENISVFGGARALLAQADAYVSVVNAANPADPTQFAYEIEADSDVGFGFMVGAAYEMPDIALRLAVSYFSEVELNFEGSENPAAPGTASGDIDMDPTEFTVTMPDSILVEGQTGVAPGTLVFGSVRWTDWSEFDATPLRYPPGALIEYDEDVITYNVGVGRQFGDNFAASASVGYEAEQNEFAANLGPTDGIITVALGGEYTINNISIGAGVTYSWIGNAVTEGSAGPLGTFDDNTAIGGGIRVGLQF